MLALISAAAAGLMGAPHCVGMCGGFAAATARTTAEGLAWQLGRISTYAVLGALAGALGDRLPGPGWLPSALAALFLVLFAAQLAGLLRLPEGKLPGLARLGGRLLRRGGIPSRYAFGLVTGLLPCGLVYAALGLALGAGTAGMGALTMAAFGAGTLPALALASAGVRRLMDRLPHGRRLMAGAVLVTGLVALVQRTPAPDAAPDALPPCHQHAAAEAP